MRLLSILNCVLPAVESKIQSLWICLEISKRYIYFSNNLLWIVSFGISLGEKNGLFWFINFENRKNGSLELEHLAASQPQNIQIADLLDPIDSMVGFVLGEKISKNQQENHVIGSPMV